MCLHIVSRSSWSHPGLDNCLALFQPGDALLLYGDGVYCLSNPRLPVPANCFVLLTDLNIRLAQSATGNNLLHRATPIDHHQWVTLAIRQPQSVSWF